MRRTALRLSPTTAVVPALLVAAALNACTSSSTAPTVDVAHLHAAATSRIRDVVKVTGLPLRSAKLLVSSCNDENQGNTFRAEIVGYYSAPTTPAASRAAVDAWATTLSHNGWRLSTSGLSNGKGLDGAPAETLDLGYLVAHAVEHPPTVVYAGPCHPLPDSERNTPGPTDKVANVLSEVQP